MVTLELRWRAWLPSAVLLALAAALILRPWEPGRAGESGPAAVPAYVLRAVDGDTLEAQLGDRREDVRLIGVDTPETVDPEEPVQCFGHRASAFTRSRTEHHRLRLVFDAERRDVYGRLLAYAYIGHRLFNAELVRRGLARTLAIPPNTLHRALFRRLERRAARRGRGLWGVCGP